MSTGTNFHQGLKYGIILCELINKLQPGSVKKVNESSLNWPQVITSSYSVCDKDLIRFKMDILAEIRRHGYIFFYLAFIIT